MKSKKHRNSKRKNMSDKSSKEIAQKAKT